MEQKDCARALRRHHRARLKKARKLYWGRGLRAEFGSDWTPRTFGMVLKTPCLCSCPMCGHYRATEGRTIQERRVYQVSVWDALAEDAPDSAVAVAVDEDSTVTDTGPVTID